MSIQISRENEQIIHDAVSAGDYHSPDEVLTDALGLLRRKQQLVRDVKAGVDQLNRGETTEYDEASLDRFLQDIQEEQERLDQRSATS
jgi:Arc/MetJ-type ribon-helix-helix transcriptional regulator